MVGVQRPSNALYGGQSHQAPAKESAGQHQGQEHQCQSSERTHHRQPVATPPGRGDNAGQTTDYNFQMYVTYRKRLFFEMLLFALPTIQSMTAILDSASNDLLSECHRRSLKKIASLPDSNEEIDDTILT